MNCSATRRVERTDEWEGRGVRDKIVPHPRRGAASPANGRGDAALNPECADV